MSCSNIMCCRCKLQKPIYFNAVAQSGFQDVAPEQDVNFILARQSQNDFMFTPNTTTITVENEGIYSIEYSLLVRSTQGLINVAYAIAINDLEDPLSFFGSYKENVEDTQRLQVDGFFITSIPKDATIKPRNKSSTETHLAGTGINNQAVNRSAISIIKIG